MARPHNDLDPDLTQILCTVVGSDQRFGHRHHIHLTFLAVHRYGMPAAISKVSAWIQQIAALQEAPQKYHATITRAWVELVAHHIQADPQCARFEIFAQRHPRLFDSHLLSAHYRPATLATSAARPSWTNPDLAPFPWSS